MLTLLGRYRLNPLILNRNHIAFDLGRSTLRPMNDFKELSALLHATGVNRDAVTSAIETGLIPSRRVNSLVYVDAGALRRWAHQERNNND